MPSGDAADNILTEKDLVQMTNAQQVIDEDELSENTHGSPSFSFPQQAETVTKSLLERFPPRNISGASARTDRVINFVNICSVALVALNSSASEGLRQLF